MAGQPRAGRGPGSADDPQCTPAAQSASEAPRADEFVVVGKVVGAYGVRGWVKIASFTVPGDNLCGYQPWFVNGAPVAVAGLRAHGAGFVACLDACADRDVASAMAGREISVRAATLPALAEGDYYWRQLVGLEVVNTLGEGLGFVHGLLATGANDVLVVRCADGREVLIPFIDKVVGIVDVAGGRLVVDWSVDY